MHCQQCYVSKAPRALPQIFYLALKIKNRSKNRERSSVAARNQTNNKDRSEPAQCIDDHQSLSDYQSVNHYCTITKLLQAIIFDQHFLLVHS
jgi:hypothetical protein